MTKAPLLPRTKSNLTDLDALIRQSQGDKAKHEAEQTISARASITSTEVQTDPVQDETSQNATGVSTDKLERLQVTVRRSIIVAAKIEAVRQNTSPSAIVALALRQYLNLPAKT